jgi:hypothetical protein
MVKPGAVVIDVGVNRVPDPAARGGSRLVGDVDFAGVRPKSPGKITPNPGGVGPMTIAMLMQNTVRAAERAPAWPVQLTMNLCAYMNPSRILPDLQCSLLCEDVRQEASGNFILVGVVNPFRVPQLPVAAFKLCFSTAGPPASAIPGNGCA